MNVITPQLLQALNVTFSTKFNDALADIAGQTPIFWPDIAEEIPSGTIEEVFGYMKGIPSYRKWIGDRQVHGLDASGYTIKSDKFELTMGVPRDAIVFDKLGIYTKLAQYYGGKARTFRDELLWPAIVSGATGIGPDGQYFYDADHPLTDQNGQPITASNYQTPESDPGPLWFLTASPAGAKPFIITKVEELDFVPMIDPTNERVFMQDEFMWGSKGRFGVGYFVWQLIQACTTAIDADNFNAAFAALATRLGDKGSKMPLIPATAWFPYSLRGTAATTLLVDRLADGASNFNFKVVDVKFVPYLDWNNG